MRQTINVAESEPIVIAHPSTKTNKSNLNGREISIGDNIIIPRDIKIDAMTISITKNGKKIKKPISNAVFSSEVIKAGKTMFNGTDLFPSKGPDLERSTNKFKVSDLVLVTMNSFRRPIPSFSARSN